jgi:glycosyltransferase involved in cell wall biosynthesis
MTFPVTVAICTKDHPELLRRCLASCQALRDDVTEIVVIDNDSAGPETRQVAEAAGVTYFLEKSPGLSAARNRAIAESHGEIIAFTDDDCEPDAHWVEALFAHFEDPQVGCVTGRALLPAGANLVQRNVAGYSGGSRGDFTYRVLSSDVVWVYPRAIAGIGANMSFRRQVLIAAGGFPEVFRNSGDDVYMFYAVLRAGYSIEYAPDAVVYQHHRDRLMQQARRTFQYGRQGAVLFAYISAENGSALHLAFNIARELLVRMRVMTKATLRGSGSHLLFGATQLAGLITGIVTMPLWGPSILRQARGRRR